MNIYRQIQRKENGNVFYSINDKFVTKEEYHERLEKDTDAKEYIYDRHTKVDILV